MGGNGDSVEILAASTVVLLLEGDKLTTYHGKRTSNPSVIRKLYCGFMMVSWRTISDFSWVHHL